MGEPSVAAACATLLSAIEQAATASSAPPRLPELAPELAELKQALELLRDVAGAQDQLVGPSETRGWIVAVVEDCRRALQEANGDILADDHRSVDAENTEDGGDNAAHAPGLLEAQRMSLDVYRRALRLAHETLTRDADDNVRNLSGVAESSGIGSSNVHRLTLDTAATIEGGGSHTLAQITRLRLDSESLPGVHTALDGLLNDLERTCAGSGNTRLLDGAVDEPYIQSPVSLGDDTQAPSIGVDGPVAAAGDIQDLPNPRRTSKKKKKVTWDLSDASIGPIHLPRSSSEPTALLGPTSVLSDEPSSSEKRRSPPPFQLDHSATLGPPPKSKAGVRGVSLSPDGTTVVAHYADESVAVWDVESRRLLEKLRLGGGSGLPWSSPKHRVVRAASVSEAEPLVAVEVERGSRGSSLELWDWQKKRKVQVLCEGAGGTGGAPPWAHVPVRHLCGEVAVWDRPANIVKKFRQTRLLTENSVLGVLKDRVLVDLGRQADSGAGGGGSKAAIALSRIKPYLAAATTAGAGPEKHALLMALDLAVAEEGVSGNQDPPLKTHVTELGGVEEPLDLGTDGQYVTSLWRRWNASASRDELCLLSWQLGTSNCREIFPPSERRDAKLSPDGRLLAMWDDTKQVSILDGRTGQVLLPNGSDGQGGRISPLYPTAVAFSDDCGIMACGNRNGSVDIFDINGFQATPKLSGRGKYSTF